MKRLFKFAVLLLLAAVAANSQMVAALPHSTNGSQRPAGCHEHGSNVPAPEPVSYQCCQSGHDSAILQASSISQPIGHDWSGVKFTCVAVGAVRFSSVIDLPEFSGRPPGIAPLRI